LRVLNIRACAQGVRAPSTLENGFEKCTIAPREVVMDMSEACSAVSPTTWVATPGIHVGVPNSEYHADRQAVSSSSLKPLLRSPAHFLASQSVQAKETRAKSFGSALHCLLLEPETFHDNYLVVRPFPTRTKEGKALADLITEAAAGREVLSETDFDALRAMVAAAKGHGAVTKMLDHGEAETTLVWRDEETGVLLKARPDWWQRDQCIWDLKSAEDGSWAGFSRACAKYEYALSCALYRIGVQALTGDLLPFRFVVLEKGAPFAAAVYEADARFIRRGEQDLRKVLRLLAQSRQSDEWPAYQRDGEIELIDLPAWK